MPEKISRTTGKKSKQDKVVVKEKVVTKTESIRRKGDLFSFKNILLVFVVMTLTAFIIAAALLAEVPVAVIVIGLIFLIILAATILAGVYSIYTYFAPNDLFWGGVPEEGTACTIVVGTEDRKGKFVKAVMSSTGNKLDKDWNIVPDETYQEGKKSFLEQIGLGGIFWIGIPKVRRRHRASFSWSSMLLNGELDPHEGVFDYVPIVEDTYATLIPKAEAAKSMVPMNITLLITAKVVNPMKARHKVDHWLQSVINLTKVPALAYIAQLDNPRELIGNKELINLFFKGHEMSKLIKYFRDEYGVEVSRVNVAAIGLGKEEEDAAMEKWKAERTAEALIVTETGKGDAYEAYMIKKKKADRQYYEMVNELGDLGITMRYLETAEKASNVVIPFGMVGDIARQVLGGNKSSDEIVVLLKEANITVEDIKNAIEMFKEMKEKD